MRIFKKSVCIVMVLSILFSFNSFALKEETAYEKQISNPEEYMQLLWDEGYDAISADTIVCLLQQVQTVISIFTGRKTESKSFNITFDKFTSGVLNYVYENSGFDVSKILKNLPDINVPANIIVDTLKIDTTAFREQMYLKKAECDADGNGAMATVYHFLGVYLSIIEECLLYAEPTEDPDVYEVMLQFTYKDKTTETVKPGILVNTVTGECTNKDDSGIIGSGFNFSLSELMLYATVDCWMRDFGFCLLYDVVANAVPVIYNYDTRRFKFDYDGLSWMIQIWKGNYFAANGGEVGIYCRTPEKIGSFYECVDDDKMLYMTMEILHGDDVLVEKEREKHWWINGFNMCGKMYLPKSLTMKFTIEMPDKEMLEAFTGAIDNHYKHDVAYTVDGLKVNVIW